MIPLNIPLDEFIKPFFDADETVCLRVFSDRKNAAFAGLKLECAAGKVLTMEETLRKHNAQNRGMYFVVNHGGHEDSECTGWQLQAAHHRILLDRVDLRQL